jgi:creatinine amidohydrolase/Fe(II)-dependent formamide hydrolase-like protein
VTESGVVGTPTRASAERGRELVDQLVSALEDLLKKARAEEDPL